MEDVGIWWKALVGGKGVDHTKSSYALIFLVARC